MNGKSVEVDNTDAEGRLVLSGEPVASAVYSQ
jgi:leucyl aminopeptidase